MTKILGIDFGFARIGLAISNEEKTFALSLKTIKSAKALQQAVHLVCDALKDRIEEIEKIVIGLPLHLNGRESKMTEHVRKFADLLQKKLGIPIVLFDERLSSKAAEQSLRELQLNRKKRSRMVDQASAVLILQNYLDQKNT